MEGRQVATAGLMETSDQKTKELMIQSALYRNIKLTQGIRLMSSEKGAETPLEKYARFHNNKREWYEEMDYYGLSLSEKKLIEKHLDASCGICESQEGMMSLLLEPEIAGWSLGKVDVVRKAVAKFWPIKE